MDTAKFCGNCGNPFPRSSDPTSSLINCAQGHIYSAVYQHCPYCPQSERNDSSPFLTRVEEPVATIDVPNTVVGSGASSSLDFVTRVGPPETMFETVEAPMIITSAPSGASGPAASSGPNGVASPSGASGLMPTEVIPSIPSYESIVESIKPVEPSIKPVEPLIKPVEPSIKPVEPLLNEVSATNDSSSAETVFTPPSRVGVLDATILPFEPLPSGSIPPGPLPSAPMISKPLPSIPLTPPPLISKPLPVGATDPAPSSALDAERRTVIMDEQTGLPRAARGKIVGWLISFTRNPDGEDFRVYAGYNRLGANPICDIVVEDETVSGSHAILVHRDGRSLIKDDLSRNGTYVNGREITEAHQLQNYDQVRIGNTVLIYIAAQRPV